jgi:hypothetical protein
MQVKEHPGYRRVKGAAQNHVYMGISTALAWEQAQLVIRRVDSCERRWGNMPQAPPSLVSARVARSWRVLGRGSFRWVFFLRSRVLHTLH